MQKGANVAIVVVGSANVDTVIRGDRLPLPGETVEASDYVELPGGKGLNQAVAASRAGTDTAFFFATGNDSGGDMLRLFLSNESLTVHGVADTAATGRAFIQINAAGENSIMIVGGANTTVTSWPTQNIFDAIQGASFLVLQQEVATELNLSLATHAKKTGTPVVLTPAPIEKTHPDLLALVDILVLNEHENAWLDRNESLSAAAKELKKTRTVIVTLGKQGAMFFHDGKEHPVVPSPTVTAVDTTGAGDCFSGFLVASLDGGAPLAEAIHTACVAAAVSVTRNGAAVSMPTGSEVNHYRKDHL